MEAEAAWDALIPFLQTKKLSPRALFVQLDRDKDQLVDIGELASGLEALGLRLTARQTRALQKALDKNSDGKLSVEELESAISEQTAAISAALDAAWDSVLDVALSEKGGRSIERQFSLMDTDRSGDLDFAGKLDYF